jgi:hypothetical protein
MDYLFVVFSFGELRRRTLVRVFHKTELAPRSLCTFLACTQGLAQDWRILRIRT